MRPTFFDYIGTADMERIHSATIAWMISDQCNAFTLDERASLLKALFNVQKADIKSIRACNEYDHIDIAFITENSKNSEQEIWVIENKIKSPLGHNQLSKYEEITKSEANQSKSRTAADEYSEVKQKYPRRHFAVLSLIGILPQDYKGEWHLVTYSDLTKYIKDKHLCDKSIFKNQNDIEHRHYSIVTEYYNCISNLVYALEQFRTYNNQFDFVFIDGSKKKSVKFENETKDNSVEKYISQNGLETLLQKDYFVSIIQEIKSRGINFDCHVSETHGNADFAFHFGNMGSHSSYVFDLSFQSGTFKFAVTEHGYPPLKDKKEENWPIELKKWKAAFDFLRGVDSHYNKLNPPKSRIRVSVSYNFDKDNNERRKWYELSRYEFVEKVIEQIENAQEMAQQVIIYYQGLKIAE